MGSELTAMEYLRRRMAALKRNGHGDLLRGIVRAEIVMALEWQSSQIAKQQAQQLAEVPEFKMRKDD